MGVWLVWAGAWLLGVFWQTGAGVLQPAWVYAWSTGVAGAALLALIWGRRRPWGVVRMPWRRRLPWAWLAMSALAVLVLAWSSTGWRACSRMHEAVPDAWAGKAVPVIVQVEGLPQAVPGGTLFDARVVSWLPLEGVDAGVMAQDWPRHLSLRMTVQEGALPVAGERWQLLVQLHAPDGQSNPGGFDGTLAYFERGVRAVGSVQGKAPGKGQAAHRISDQAEWPWQGVMDRWRLRIRALIFEHVPDRRAAGILAGLSVGDQSAIEHEDWDLFRQAGITHLVSISGAHIAMFGWMAALLVRRLWSLWPRGMHWWPAPDVAMWAALCASGLYAVLAGWGVPAQRTVWMMALVCWLRAGGRRWPWPLVWASSAVGLTVLDPWALRQAGFWLSYVAVGVLLSSGMNGARQGGHEHEVPTPALGVRMQSWAAQAWGGLLTLVRIQCLITLALMPLSLVVFQQASLSSLLVNLIAIPAFTIGITPMALLGAIWAPCWDAGVWMINGLMGLVASLVHWWPAMASSPVLPWWVALCGVVAGAALALPLSWRLRLGLLPFFVPMFCLPQGWHLLPAPRPGSFALIAADVGQGTAVLVRTAHHTLLFDTGPRIGEQLNAGDRTLLPLFRALGVNQLDALMISHQDTDHVGGAAAIIGQMPVAKLISSLDEAHALRHQPGTDGAALPHVACQAGQQWEWDGVHFEVLHPWPQDYASRSEREPNAMSCVLKVSASDQGRASALLTGDIEADQEAALVAQDAARLHSTVLVAAHHGSQTSSTAGFLQAVQPEQVVVQVGRRNRYGHPSPPVLARYEAMQLNWVATPACGAFVWSTDQEHAELPEQAGAIQAGAAPRLGQCWRPGHHRYWDQPSPMQTRALKGRPRSDEG
ncbi:DNA internalization-related competence protein ComEC/Rec2 [Aquabacterium sp.]|uniref:DNA internalization-related competence protein ComEC/Rec2 n=1 Tax=Aquabacterium sp. TaxID=1872578 RepID=UPI0040383907